MSVDAERAWMAGAVTGKWDTQTPQAQFSSMSWWSFWAPGEVWSMWAVMLQHRALGYGAGEKEKVGSAKTAGA